MGSVTNGTAAPAQWTIQNPFRDSILRGEITAVMSVSAVTTNEMPILCRTAGVRALFIDTEHSALSLETVQQLILACNYSGVSPLVRVPSKSPWHLSRALDSGACAVVVPHVETVGEVRRLVQAAKYAPIGNRGCSGMQPLLGFQHVPTRAQNELLNRETMLIPMVETPGAVDLAAEFLAFEGVDGLLVGSNDLCADMGIPGEYAVTKVVLAGKAAGKPVGIGGIWGRLDLLERWFAMGATWSLSGGDLAMLQAGIKKMGDNCEAMNQRVQKVRAASEAVQIS